MAATEPDGGAPLTGQGQASGDDPLTADLVVRGPRITTRMLVAAVLVLGVLLVATLVVALVVLHQPHLAPLPVPSVSSIA